MLSGNITFNFNTAFLKKILILLVITGYTTYSQIDTAKHYDVSKGNRDTIKQHSDEIARSVDSLNLTVRDIIITGNEITKDEIILREMSLKKGSKFTIEKYLNDQQNIYNLGLFTRSDILPVQVSEKEVILDVEVQERWYIYPVPVGGVDEGEYWKKFWCGVNLTWNNFRGRNETLNLYGRIFYNPALNISYSVPWIGKKLHLFSSFSAGVSRNRNQSLLAIGRINGENTITYETANYENYNFNTDLQIGKYFTKRFYSFIDGGYNYLRVSEYAPGRTIDINGKDRYLNLGFGLGFDSRNVREFATRGMFFRSTYERYGFIDKAINYGEFTFESQTFLPVNITKYYFITLATRLYTSLAIGSVIPYYQHQYLGYSYDYVRGWSGIAYEGEDKLTVYNELRIPVITPRYMNAQKLPIVRSLPIIGHMELRYGLYFTLIYDIGTVFDHTDRIYDQPFLSGTGAGIDVVLPFGVIGRADWVFRTTKPHVGQLGLGLSAKF